MNIFKLLRKNEGFAMVFTLLLIVIILVLITVLINISITEYKQAERNKDKITAYFLARSGAEVLANLIVAIDEDDDNSIGEPQLASATDMSLTDKDGNGISKVDVIKLGSDYTLVSTATVDGLEETVSVEIKKPELSAIFAKSELNFEKMSLVELYGQKVETNSSVIKDPKNLIPDEDEIVDSDKVFGSIDWEYEFNNRLGFEYVNTTPATDITNDIINSSGYYGSNIDYNNTTITFDFENEDVLNIFVDDFSTKGEIAFQNSGDNILDNKILNIFVSENSIVTFQTPNVQIESFNLFLASDCDLLLIGSTDTTTDNGMFVYGPDSSVGLQSQVTFRGIIIADNLQGRNTSNEAMGSFYYEGPPNQQGLDYIREQIAGYNKYNIFNWGR